MVIGNLAIPGKNMIVPGLTCAPDVVEDDGLVHVLWSGERCNGAILDHDPNNLKIKALN